MCFIFAKYCFTLFCHRYGLDSFYWKHVVENLELVFITYSVKCASKMEFDLFIIFFCIACGCMYAADPVTFQCVDFLSPSRAEITI